MSPYNWLRPTYWVGFLAAIALGYYHIIPIWIAPLWFISYTLFLAWSVFHMEVNLFTKSVVAGKANQQGIALTFDDGPHPEHTEKVLEILKKHQAVGTFFAIGNNIKEHPELARKIHAEGHVLGNHSTSHAKWIDLNKKKDWIKEIETTNKIINAEIGQKPRFFRPPYGVTTPHLNLAIKATGVRCIGWNVRSLDTLTNNVSEIVGRSTKNLKNGSIVLFHDNLPWSAQVLDEFLVEAKKKNLKVVSLSNLIEEQAYE